MNKIVRDVLAALPDGQATGRISPRNKIWALPISGLGCDSRRATEDTVFFCLVGKTSDGHLYAPDAYRNGCRVFVVERPLELPADALQYRVPDTRHALADCAAAFYDHPERRIRLIGLTGTKGKTTTALLIRTLLTDAGIPTGYVGTNGVDYGDLHFHTVNSTPESLDIYRYLRDMVDAGMQACVLEVSSQALWMERTRGLIFDTVLFTNLSRDHIGGVEHPDFDHYRDCKRRLFDSYPYSAVAANTDDPHTAFMTEGVSAPLYTFGLDRAEGDAPLWLGQHIRPAKKQGRIGVSFEVLRGGISPEGEWFLPLPGRFNVQNALAALSVACERFGVSPACAKESLSRAVVAGRFETVTHPAFPDVTFVIDYAHNGVSLTSILEALRVYEPTRLICLFGSVGGRTTERRRDLAEAAAYRADLCILTSDNPGCEHPDEIIDEINAAVPPDACPRMLISDRGDAIARAVKIAKAGDIILLAGKGHEDYQLIGTRRVPYSETDTLKQALEAAAAATVR